MRRRMLIWFLALTALAFAAGALMTARTPVIFYGDPWNQMKDFAGIQRSRMIVQYPAKGNSASLAAPPLAFTFT